MERQSCPVSFKIFRPSAHSVHFQNWPQNQASQKIEPPIQTTEKCVCFFAWNLELILSNSEGRSSSSVLSCLAYYARATWGVVIELTRKTASCVWSKTSLSWIVKARSANTRSPGFRFFSKAQCSVKYLSEVRPPHALDIKRMEPWGVIPMSTFTVLWCL